MYFANTIRLNCHNKTSKSEIAQLKVEGCFFLCNGKEMDHRNNGSVV